MTLSRDPLAELTREFGAPLPSLSHREPVTELHQSRQSHFDIWHEVPLVPQTTGMSCWAAAAAMIVGWRDCLHVESLEITRGMGAWRAFRAGLLPKDVESLAQSWRLNIEPVGRFGIEELRRLLETKGPLWIGEADPGLHVVVIIGIHGDGTLDGTKVRINDPYPIGRGSRYSMTVRKLLENFETARDIGGIHAQILHAGTAEGRSSSQSYTIHREFRSERTF